jgi:hypothetical protein
MKKFTLLLLFCLFSFGAFAGNPKYMHVSLVYKGLSTTLFIIDETGKIEEQKLKMISNGFSVSADKVVGIQKEVQDKLNELGAKGWKVVGISNMDNPAFAVVNYLLTKEEAGN